MKKELIGTMAAAGVMMGGLTASAAGTDPELTAVTQSFCTAGDQQDASAMEKLLHPDFRTLFTFGQAGEAAQLPRDQYIEMIRAKKFGGDARTVQIKSTERVSDNVAYVKASLVGKKATLHSLLILVRHQGHWRIYQDAARLDKE